MFIGHYAVGFGARAAAPASRSPGLGTWFLAVQWLDLLWPAFVLLGWERVRIEPGNTALTPLAFEYYPYSHSLLAAALWALAFALVYRWRGGTARSSALLAGGVLSHWVLDLLVHAPDLPLYPGGPRVGLALWNVPAVEIPLEVGLFVTGAALYLWHTRARDRTGRYALWGLLALLGLTHAANLTGPPPPGATAVAAAGLGMWLLVAWGWWIDRHREPRPPAARFATRGAS